MAEGKTNIVIREVTLGCDTKKVGRGHVDSVPRNGEKLVYGDKTYEVVQVIHGLWHSQGEMVQQVTLNVVPA